jgi:hypothetical protein
MTLSELIPWLAMATILILPLLSDGPPELPSGQRKQAGTAKIYFSRVFW